MGVRSASESVGLGDCACWRCGCASCADGEAVREVGVRSNVRSAMTVDDDEADVAKGFERGIGMGTEALLLAPTTAHVEYIEE